MSEIGYTMTAEVKILRRKHMVRFRIGMRAEDFKKAFARVPPNATVDEVIEGASGAEGDICSIEFHEEVVDDS